MTDPVAGQPGMFAWKKSVDDGLAAVTTAVRPVAHTFVTLGDSRMARDGSVDGVALTGETSVYNSDRGIMAWANLILRKRLKFIKNGGVGGDTVAQMLARVDSLLALNPGWLIGFGHVNSVSAGLTVSQITADLTSIFDKVDAAGVRLVWGTDWPGASATTAQRAVSYGVNDWLRRQTQVRRNFILADLQAVFVDPTTGNPLTNYTADGLHQETLGALPLGQQLANAMTPHVEISDRLIASNDDPTNIVTNGMMVGSAGGGFASSWGYSSTALQGAPSKVARTDGFPGEWQQITVSLVSPPVITLGTAGTGGSFAAGTYYWKVTATTAGGETTGSNEKTATLAAGQQQPISWSTVPGATGYKVYRGTSAGAENVLVATLGAVTTYTDTGSSGSTASVPSTNTTGTGGNYFFRWNVPIGATVAVGDTVYGEGEFQTDATNWNPTKFYMQVAMVGSIAAGTVIQAADMLHMPGAPTSPVRIASGLFRTPPIVVPTGTTSINFGVALEGGTGTFRVARMRLAKPMP